MCGFMYNTVQCCACVNASFEKRTEKRDKVCIDIFVCVMEREKERERKGEEDNSCVCVFGGWWLL